MRGRNGRPERVHIGVCFVAHAYDRILKVSRTIADLDRQLWV
jgi:predicted ATPase with chaperone activity